IGPRWQIHCVGGKISQADGSAVARYASIDPTPRSRNEAPDPAHPTAQPSAWDRMVPRSRDLHDPRLLAERITRHIFADELAHLVGGEAVQVEGRLGRSLPVPLDRSA